MTGNAITESAQGAGELEIEHEWAKKKVFRTPTRSIQNMNESRLIISRETRCENSEKSRKLHIHIAKEICFLDLSIESRKR